MDASAQTKRHAFRGPLPTLVLSILAFAASSALSSPAAAVPAMLPDPIYRVIINAGNDFNRALARPPSRAELPPLACR